MRVRAFRFEPETPRSAKRARGVAVTVLLATSPTIVACFELSAILSQYRMCCLLLCSSLARTRWVHDLERVDIEHAGAWACVCAGAKRTTEKKRGKGRKTKRTSPRGTYHQQDTRTIRFTGSSRTIAVPATFPQQQQHVEFVENFPSLVWALHASKSIAADQSL